MVLCVNQFGQWPSIRLFTLIGTFYWAKHVLLSLDLIAWPITAIHKWDFRIWSCCTHRTLPPQNWQSSPCHPSGQIQLAFVQMPPFIQELSLMHFPKTTLLQQIISIKSTNKINKHFRWLCIECKSSILNIWAKLFSIFDFATFSLANVVVFELLGLWYSTPLEKENFLLLFCVFLAQVGYNCVPCCSIVLLLLCALARSHPKLSLLLTWTIY